MSRWVCAMALAGICAACRGPGADQPSPDGTDAQGTTALSATAPAPDNKKSVVPIYHEVTIPAGTTLRLELKSAVSSDESQVEDAVRATLRQPVRIDGQTILPAGTELVGTVVDVARSGRVKGRARVAYRFDSLRHEGERYGVSTAQIAHQAQGTKRKDATKIGVGAGVGAAVGAILGGGSGAAKGAAIGSAAGTGAVLATRGDEVRLGPGADINTRLTAPLTVRVKS